MTDTLRKLIGPEAAAKFPPQRDIPESLLILIGAPADAWRHCKSISEAEGFIAMRAIEWLDGQGVSPGFEHNKGQDWEVCWFNLKGKACVVTAGTLIEASLKAVEDAKKEGE